MLVEVKFSLNDTLIKRIRLYTERDKSIIEVLELRENHLGTSSGWLPIYVKVHDQYYPARLEFLGLLAEVAYENCNNTVDTSRENIFVRGSFTKFNGG